MQRGFFLVHHRKKRWSSSGAGGHSGKQGRKTGKKDFFCETRKNALVIKMRLKKLVLWSPLGGTCHGGGKEWGAVQLKQGGEGKKGCRRQNRWEGRTLKPTEEKRLQCKTQGGRKMGLQK